MSDTITVIGRDRSNTRHGYEEVLIYTFDAADPSNADEVKNKFVLERMKDMEDGDVDEDDIEVLFCFEGSIKTLHDWR